MVYSWTAMDRFFAVRSSVRSLVACVLLPARLGAMRISWCAIKQISSAIEETSLRSLLNCLIPGFRFRRLSPSMRSAASVVRTAFQELAFLIATVQRDFSSSLELPWA